MMITGTNLESSEQALEFARKYGELFQAGRCSARIIQLTKEPSARMASLDLHATVGCHPTSTSEIDRYKEGTDGYKRDLEELISGEIGKGADSRLVAIGEIGLGESIHSPVSLHAICHHILEPRSDLVSSCFSIRRRLVDYDRLHYSSANTQLRHLPYLLSLAEKYGLPIFLHSRHPDAHRGLVDAFRAAGWEKGIQQSRGRMGVVHSFTGSREEMEELVSLCSIFTTGLE
jgi:TatD DNase family protein